MLEKLSRRPIVDSHLGQLPVEAGLKAADMAPTFRRLPDGQRLTTDAGNYIIDLHLEVIEHPQALAYYLEQTIGVVEHGLFLNVADAVIIGGEKLVIIERENVENH